MNVANQTYQRIKFIYHRTCSYIDRDSSPFIIHEHSINSHRNLLSFMESKKKVRDEIFEK